MNAYVNVLKQNQLMTMYNQQGINFVGLFGSYARGEQTNESDVDLLVDFNETKSLFELVDIQLQFEKALGKKVDLVIKNHLKKTIQPYVNRDLITAYEQNR